VRYPPQKVHLRLQQKLRQGLAQLKNETADNDRPARTFLSHTLS
jgi:hypothetical protein